MADVHPFCIRPVHTFMRAERGGDPTQFVGPFLGNLTLSATTTAAINATASVAAMSTTTAIATDANIDIVTTTSTAKAYNNTTKRLLPPVTTAAVATTAMNTTPPAADTSTTTTATTTFAINIDTNTVIFSCYHATSTTVPANCLHHSH